MTSNHTKHDPSPLEPITRREVLSLVGMAGFGALFAACSKSASSGAVTSAAVTSPAPTSPAPTTTTTAATTDAATGSTASPAAGACTLTAEQEQGPFYYSKPALRADITDGKVGIPMKLRVTVMDLASCAPVPDAAVDVWHADAAGAYSDSSTGLFLRGIQLTGADGVATFDSIYPGWYPRRTNHVHVKVHEGGSANGTYTGGHVSHTGNLFFPEDVSLAVAELSPYTSNSASRTPLTADFVYSGQNGAGSVMTITETTPGDPSKGYVAAITVTIDTSATPAGIGIAGEVN